MHTTFTVNNSGDTASPSAANCAAGNANTCTLRDAVTAANADTGNTDGITVPFGMTVTLSNGDIEFTNSVLVSGDGATVNGNGGQIFYEDTNQISVQITGLTLTGGSAAVGGAVELENGALLIDSVVFNGNTATASSSSEGGGGLYADGGEVWVSNSLFVKNTAVHGGGAFLGSNSSFITATSFGDSSPADANVATDGAGLENYDSALTLTDSSFTNNAGTNGVYSSGVGFYNDDITDASNDVFNNNTTNLGGSGIGVLNYEQLTLSDSQINGNSATGGGVDGGALYDDGYIGDYSNVTVNGTTNSSNGGDIYGGALDLDASVENWQGGSVTNTNNGADGASDYVEGGVVYADSDNLTMSGTPISNTTNNALPSEGVEGGVIYNSDYTHLDNLTVSNTSNSGEYVYAGFMYNDSYSSADGISVSSTTNHGSYATGGYVYGGVIYNVSYGVYDNLTATGTTDTADLAAAATPSTDSSYVYGGAIYNDDYLSMQSASVTNTTVTASGGAGYVYGGVFQNYDWVNLQNANMTGFSVTADHYTYGGALYSDDYMNAVNFTLGSGSVSVPGSSAETTPYADGSMVYSSSYMNFINTTIDDISTSVGSGGDYNWGVEIDTSTGEQLTNTTIANDAVAGPSGNTNLIWIDTNETLAMLNTIVVLDDPVAQLRLRLGWDHRLAGQQPRQRQQLQPEQAR